MDVGKISFDGKTLDIGAKTFELEYPIHDAFVSKDRIIVLFDHMAQREAGQFNNLVAINRDGDRIWVAEHPTTTTSDVYIEIVEKDPLIVWNFAGYRCTIDVDDGKLIEARFTK